MAFGFLLLLQGPLLSQEIKIVSPREWTDEDGDTDGSPENCCPPFRYQQVFPADDFDVLPDGRGLLTQIAFRPDGFIVDEPRTSNFFHIELRLSTTSRGPDDISFFWEENIESDETLVIDDEVTVETANLGPEGGPKEFDYVVPFQTPFLYDTNEGNLLTDWIFHDGLSPGCLCDAFLNPITTLYASPPDLLTGGIVAGLVHEFTFLPESGSVRCDFDGDGACNVADIDLLTAAADLATGLSVPPADPDFDLNDDQNLDRADLGDWLAMAADANGLSSPYLLGDADLNRRVEFADFLQLSNHFGQTGAVWSHGDFDGDGSVAFADFLSLSAQFGQSVEEVAAVPEPSSLLLCWFTMLCFLYRVRLHGRRVV